MYTALNLYFINSPWAKLVTKMEPNKSYFSLSNTVANTKEINTNAVELTAYLRQIYLDLSAWRQTYKKWSYDMLSVDSVSRLLTVIQSRLIILSQISICKCRWEL